MSRRGFVQTCPDCRGVLMWMVDSIDHPSRYWRECADCHKEIPATEAEFDADHAEVDE